MPDLRIKDVNRGKQLTIVINGHKTVAYRGETVHAALLASGYRMFRKTKKENEPRGIFCGMGICYDCLVMINGKPNQRACMQRVEDCMEIEIYEG